MGTSPPLPPFSGNHSFWMIHAFTKMRSKNGLLTKARACKFTVHFNWFTLLDLRCVMFGWLDHCWILTRPLHPNTYSAIQWALPRQMWVVVWEMVILATSADTIFQAPLHEFQAMLWGQLELLKICVPLLPLFPHFSNCLLELLDEELQLEDLVLQFNAFFKLQAWVACSLLPSSVLMYFLIFWIMVARMGFT